MRTKSMSEGEPTTPVLRSLRLVASFALLGAVLAGVTLGWMDHFPFDPRIVGAALGAGAAIAAKAAHAL
jgi:hypothetical protein